jgi:hypothetical protein
VLYRPFADLKSGMPADTDIPAPTSTMMFRLDDNEAAMESSLSSNVVVVVDDDDDDDDDDVSSTCRRRMPPGDGRAAPDGGPSILGGEPL